MGLFMAKKSHEFDFLNLWASWADLKIAEIISAENIDLMQRVVDLLSEDLFDNYVVVNRENFVRTVREMKKRYSHGSKSFSNALITASELVKEKKYYEAMGVYERYLSVCRYKFYRGIAKGQLNKIRIH